MLLSLCLLYSFFFRVKAGVGWTEDCVGIGVGCVRVGACISGPAFPAVNEKEKIRNCDKQNKNKQIFGVCLTFLYFFLFFPSTYTFKRVRSGTNWVKAAAL